jgi:hypothetical protein
VNKSVIGPAPVFPDSAISTLSVINDTFAGTKEALDLLVGKLFVKLGFGQIEFFVFLQYRSSRSKGT